MSNGREAVQCLGKFKHNSLADANKQRRNKKFLDAYRCPFCGFWHVGKHPKKRKRDENRYDQ